MSHCTLSSSSASSTKLSPPARVSHDDARLIGSSDIVDERLLASLTCGVFRPLLAALAIVGVVAVTGCDAPPVADGGDGDGDGDGDEDDAGVVEDAGVESTALRARIYLHDPLTDDGETTEVTLVPPTTTDGTLTSDSVNALNCMNKAGGQTVFGFATLCVEEKSVFPDDEGSYLAIMPPADIDDGEDPFAELMMYHHVNIVHDYFNGTHGLTDLDFPLDAVTNIMFQMQGTWQSFPNAAFIPAESFAAFGLPARDFGAIMFGQGDGIDFSYDATVIYHEYTHAVVGPNRLNATLLDDQGLNNLPGAINEGMADYFASTITDTAALGAYALGSQYRDLASPRRCPENITTAIHTDGKIIGSALWAFRDAVGSDVADRIAFKAIMQATQTTTLEQFGGLLVNAAGAEGQTIVDTLSATLDDHGVLTCDRVKPWGNINFALQHEGVPHTVEGKGSIALAGGVPGYHQWAIELAADEKVVLSWSVQAGGGFFGGAAQPVGIAFNAGERITVSQAGTINADEIVPLTLAADGTTQTVALDASCLPAGGGTVYATFVNTGDAASTLTRIGIERDLATLPADVPVGLCP